MWCDNCLLLFPLRWGALLWSAIIGIYSIVGGVLLLKYGEFIYFRYSEWYLFGGVSLFVALIAWVNVFALANESAVFSRVCRFLWPTAVILSAIRAVLMIVELNRGKSNIQWECDNGGFLFGATSSQYDDGVIPSFPTGICRYGVTGLYTAMVISLLVDLGFQIYMLFLNWRFTKRMEKYAGMVGPVRGGYYDA